MTKFLKPYLRSGYKQEAGCQQQTLQRGLCVTELDAVEVQHRLTVRQDESVQSQDLEHLQRRHQCTPALLDYVTNWNEITVFKVYFAIISS